MPVPRPLVGIAIALLIGALAVALVAAQNSSEDGTPTSSPEVITDEATPISSPPEVIPDDSTPISSPPELIPEDSIPISSPPEAAPVEPTPIASPTAAATAGPLPPSSFDLAISDFSFDPPDVTVVAGATLKWRNAGPSSHTVTSVVGMFDSGAVAAGRDFSILIAAPGEYRYVCAIHQSMRGTIRVTFPDGSPGPPAATDNLSSIPVPVLTPGSPSQSLPVDAVPGDSRLTATLALTPNADALSSATPTADADATRRPTSTRGPVGRTATPVPPTRSAVGPARAPSPTSSEPTTATVDIADFLFRPQQVRVASGGTVTWTNRGQEVHSAFGSGEFDTRTIAPGASRSVTFDTPGTFPYHCSIHPNMTGTVVVL